MKVSTVLRVIVGALVLTFAWLVDTVVNRWIGPMVGVSVGFADGPEQVFVPGFVQAVPTLVWVIALAIVGALVYSELRSRKGTSNKEVEDR